eukprot:CAMPEP_0172701862 /NCGR_PEP_ID=MMETSP1074-20121228/32091_1 /TAXON_ID=2916 /ORGANISM="Ceratium fusus, Strain PA161109" /LENGTH=59 /DNA_ID=CAMNT_0013523459 /DNA_START=20 /DNA_END=196 /DNA_ORIENTATION=+
MAMREVLGQQSGCFHGTGSMVAGRTAVRLTSWSTWDMSPVASMALCTQAHTITRLEHRK